MASTRSAIGDRLPAGLRRISEAVLSGSGLHLIDSGIASSSNFLLGIVVASRVSTEDFGRYGAAFALYSMTFGVWRAFGADAFLLSRTKTPKAIGATISASAWLGLTFGFLGALLSLAVGSENITQRFLLAFAIGLPVLAVQDAVRFVLIGLGKTANAIAINTAWLLLMAATLLSAVDAVTVVALWIGAALVSSTIGMFLLGWPRIGGGITWIRSHFSDSTKFAVEFWINSVSLLIVFFAVGLFGGLVEMGAYRAAAVLVGPVAVVSNGLMTTAQLLDPKRLGGQDFRRRLQLLVAAGLASGLFTAGLLAALPRSMGELLLGESWAKAQPVGIPLAISLGTLAALMATVGTFRALGRTSQGYRYRIGGLVLVGAGGTAGSFHSAFAAATTMAICGFVAMAMGLHGLWPHLNADREPQLSTADSQ